MVIVPPYLGLSEEGAVVVAGGLVVVVGGVVVCCVVVVVTAGALQAPRAIAAETTPVSISKVPFLFNLPSP